MPRKRHKKRIIIPELLSKSLEISTKVQKHESKKLEKNLDDKLLKFKFLCSGGQDDC